jgi:hypothetical protein
MAGKFDKLRRFRQGQLKGAIRGGFGGNPGVVGREDLQQQRRGPKSELLPSTDGGNGRGEHFNLARVDRLWLQIVRHPENWGPAVL